MSAESPAVAATVVPTWQTWRFRLAGLIPLAFFMLRVADYVKWDKPANIWWNCHVANLTLGMGMLLGNRLLIRVAAIWLLLGVPPWFIDMVFTGIIWPLAVLTHVGGAAVGLVALKWVRMERGVWWVALLWFVVLQQLSRYFTPLEFNVNVAHHGYGPLQHWFGNYWQYWLANTAGAALLLWLLEWSLAKLFPAKQGK